MAQQTVKKPGPKATNTGRKSITQGIWGSWIVIAWDSRFNIKDHSKWHEILLFNANNQQHLQFTMKNKTTSSASNNINRWLIWWSPKNRIQTNSQLIQLARIFLGPSAILLINVLNISSNCSQRTMREHFKYYLKKYYLKQWPLESI